MIDNRCNVPYNFTLKKKFHSEKTRLENLTGELNAANKWESCYE